MKRLLIFLFIANVIVLYAQNVDANGNKVVEKTLTSSYFENDRIIKISLPENYDNSKKYPVIYTLDGHGLFSITASYTSFLIKYDVIPSSIVVSVFHNNRDYETSLNYGQNVTIPKTELLEGAKKLKNHLLKEVKPLIEKEYSTSGFNVLVGHSNTASFANELISKKDNSFQGFIAMTPDLAEEQIVHLRKYLSNEDNKKVYYFVSSGLKDEKSRLQTGQSIDTIFQTIKKANIIGKHSIYNAGHIDLVPKSLNDGLMFVFSEYRNYDDFHEFAEKDNFSVKDYITEKLNSTNDTYGISSSFNEDDYFYLFDYVIDQKDKLLFEQILDIGEANHFYSENHLYSDRAQSYEEAGFYEEALVNWTKHLESGNFTHTFYYERPFRLLADKLNRPKEGIDFLEKSIKKNPKGKLVFKYWIAKTVLKNDLSRKKGIKAIQYCIDNFEENRKFNLKDAKNVKSELLKK
jgi:predicted alpha/beta superfamily hydrolase